MEAKGLSIGNYLHSPILQREFIATARDIAYIDDDPKNAKPIPLTEQWLKDFGFKNSGNNNYKQLHYTCMVRSHGINICNNHGYIQDIKYVHQLQNLYFALTGKELIK